MQLPLSLRQPSLPLPLRLLLLPLLLLILPNPLLPLLPLQPLMLLMTMFRTEHFVCLQQTPHLRHQGVFKVQPCPTPTTKNALGPASARDGSLGSSSDSNVEGGEFIPAYSAVPPSAFGTSWGHILTTCHHQDTPNNKTSTTTTHHHLSPNLGHDTFSHL
jgi:hypothetical protein